VKSLSVIHLNVFGMLLYSRFLEDLEEEEEEDEESTDGESDVDDDDDDDDDVDAEPGERDCLVVVHQPDVQHRMASDTFLDV